jgi:hypothetical protein
MRKTVLGILGAIVIGALGSALWELIKPGFSFLGATAVTATSIGITSLIDGIYISAGRADLGVLWVKATVLFAIGFVALFYALLFIWKSLQVLQSSVPRIGSAKPTVLKVAALTMFGTFCLTGGTRHLQVSDITERFKYLRRASAPYFTEDERLKIDSRFALITGKREFEVLTDDLRERLRENGVTLSED